jgi:hypothetical protein
VRIGDTARQAGRGVKKEVLFRICDFTLESYCSTTTYRTLAWIHERQ